MKGINYFFLIITICSSCANPIYMPQDEHVAFVANKGDLGLAFNPILSDSPWQLQSSFAYCPIENVEINANAVNGNGYQNYTLGGGLFKKWAFLDSSAILKFGGMAYYSWMKIENFTEVDFQNLEGTAHLNQYRLQSYVSYYGKGVEIYFGAKATIFDAKRFQLGEFYTIDMVNQILEKETKPILESTLRLRLKSKYVHLYAGLNNVLWGVPADNPFYRTATIYGGVQFQISEILRQ